jgi:glutamate synthase domain-containing protein 1
MAMPQRQSLSRPFCSLAFHGGEIGGYDGMQDSLRAQFYRTEAKRLREKAENMDSPEIRQAYEGMAIHYELLLEGPESPAKRSPPRKAALEWGWGT